MRLFVLSPFVALLMGATLLMGSGPAAAADPAAPLAAHRALYQLTLDQARGTDVAGATGTMAYEVVDACDGWATRQRLQMTVTNRDGQDIEMLSDYTTWESKDGLNMRFRMRQTTETAVTSEVAGSATLEHTGGPGEAQYTAPETATRKLPAGTLFPTAPARSSSPCRCSTAPARRAPRTVRWRSSPGTDRNRTSGPTWRSCRAGGCMWLSSTTTPMASSPTTR